ncbi:hypothetical protein [Nostoc sp.]|uniref:hypothetical protein n=1 Tax=Nostoc sp. TaxID=1180 RepID=UPI002FF9512F
MDEMGVLLGLMRGMGRSQKGASAVDGFPGIKQLANPEGVKRIVFPAFAPFEMVYLFPRPLYVVGVQIPNFFKKSWIYFFLFLSFAF